MQEQFDMTAISTNTEAAASMLLALTSHSAEALHPFSQGMLAAGSSISQIQG